MAIDLNTFSATKYKETIYQIRLTSYLSQYEDFEESDFIENETKLFCNCLNAVDFLAYCENMDNYHYLKHEVGEFNVAELYPTQNSQVLDYIDKNSGQEKRLQKAFSMILSFLNDKGKLLLNQQTQLIRSKDQAQKAPETYIPKPCFEPQSIESIMLDLSTFFDISQHSELKRIIETGSNANEKLLFRDSGNRLTDYFKLLFESDKIVGCTKNDLINWIVQNFKYTFRKTQRDFIHKTVEKTISGNEQPCKNPIT